MGLRSRRSRQNTDVWPGFVDALASILLVFVFLLLIFVLGQFYLTDILQGRNKALDEQQSEISKLADNLDTERHKLSEQDQRLLALNKALHEKKSALDILQKESEALQAKVARLAITLERQQQALDQAKQQGLSDQALILNLTQNTDLLTASLDDNTKSLKQSEQLTATQKMEILDLLKARQLLESEVAKLAARLDQQKEALTLANTLSETLEEQLKNSDTLAKAKMSELTERDLRLRSMVDRIAKIEQLLLDEKQQNMLALTKKTAQDEQLVQLENTNLALSTQLALSQEEVEKLGQRLNVQLAKKVQQLNRYRSEFFGRLREVLGDRDDIKIVGDRFLFQSEVLFSSASDVLGQEGLIQLAQLAKTLTEVSQKIPEGIDWIVRVDGHTDNRPIHNEVFDSNWELSTARALSIVKFLITQGIPPEHLAATGFGEFHPLDNAETDEAYNKNRRIEIKLTNR